MEKPLVNQKYLLEKIPGKGGWTYASIPEILQDKSTPFGWVKVKGSIDGYEIRKYHLMPFGNGSLFLPVKAEIRKKIKKNVGDYVHVILFRDDEPLEIPQEMLLCLEDEPEAHTFFKTLGDGDQSNYIKWIYAARSEEGKVERLAQTISRLLKRLRFYDSDDK